MRECDAAAAESDRLTRLKAEREAGWRSASMLQSQVEQWLQDGKPGGTTLAAFDGEAPTLNDGEDIIGAINSLRNGVKQLKAKLHDIETAGYRPVTARSARSSRSTHSPSAGRLM
jgi:hypothetical protein